MINISTFLNIRSEPEVTKYGQHTYFGVFEVFLCMFFHTTNLLNLWKRVLQTDHICFSVCLNVFLLRYLTGRWMIVFFHIIIMWVILDRLYICIYLICSSRLVVDNVVDIVTQCLLIFLNELSLATSFLLTFLLWKTKAYAKCLTENSQFQAVVPVVSNINEEFKIFCIFCSTEYWSFSLCSQGVST